MERRQAVALAATASAVFFLGAAGLTANAAILGDGGGGDVGTISPVDPGATQPAPGSTEDQGVDVAPETLPASTDADTSTGASAISGDASHEDDEDHDEDAEYENEDHEDEDDEHEGGEDDD